MKHIFRKKGQEYIGRHSVEVNYVPKIPGIKSEARLVDEIDFFLIENPFLNMESEDIVKLISNQVDQLIPMDNVKQAHWIGTDYDFIYNMKQRTIIFENCLDYESAALQFRDYRLNDPIIENVLSSNSNVAQLIDQGLNLDGNHDFEQFF